MIYRRFITATVSATVVVAIAFSGVIRAATDAATMTFLKISYTSDSTGSAVFDSTEIYSINSGGTILSGAGQFVNTASNPGKDVSAFTARFVKCFVGGNVGAQAIRINDAGDIAGIRGGSVAGVAASGFVCKASGELVNINVPGALSTVVRGFNNNGDVSGYYQDQFGAKHGYIFKNGAFTKIDYVGTPANPFSGTVIYAINDKGDAVGSAEDSKHDTQAFIYSNGLIKPLPALPAAPSRPTSFPAPYVGIMEPRGINNNGQVVGTYTYFDSSLAGKSKGIVLNGASWQLVDYPNAANTSFWAINDKGQIAGGFGNNYLSPENGFIANPILLDADIFDATGVAVSANENDGVLYDKGKSALTETALSAFNPPSQAKGLVADGNARLIIRTKSNVSGIITVTVNSKPTTTEPDNTGTSATVYPVLASGTVNTNGSASLSTQEVATGTQLPHQASFTIRAGYDYSGPEKSEKSPFSIDLCLKKSKDSTSCDASKHIQLAERRAPILLLHGLWSRSDTFETPINGSNIVAGDPSTFFSNMLSFLQNINYKNARTYSFDRNSGGDDGPSVTMAPSNRRLTDAVEESCTSEIASGYSCTRAIFITHSMGGLVARKFSYDNIYYNTPFNFNLGSISKIITLGTPHSGSPLADLLNQHLPCVAPERYPRLFGLLDFLGYKIRTGILDLDTQRSQLLSSINGKRQNINIAFIAGDVGINSLNIGIDIDDEYLQWLSGCNRQQVFGGQHTDGIVPISSATAKSPRVSILSSVTHIGMGRNAVINQEVRRILGSRTLDVFDSSIGPLTY